MSDSNVMASLKGASPTLFLVAGLLFLVSAANNAAVQFVDGYDLTVVSGVGLLLGLLAALLGVVGLYPTLRSHTPRLAKASVGCVGIGLAGIVGMIAWVTTNSGGDPSPILAIGSLVMIVLGFALFSGALLRTDAYPTLVGMLLLAEAAALFSVFALPALTQGDLPQWGLIVIEGVQAALLLGIGHLLRQNASRLARVEPTAA